jgi:hypothetical protein
VVSEPMEIWLIEPRVLAELAEKALQDEKRTKNPYLRALMARLGRLALELKAALESEGRLDDSQGPPAGCCHDHK